VNRRHPCWRCTAPDGAKYVDKLIDERQSVTSGLCVCLRCAKERFTVKMVYAGAGNALIPVRPSGD